MPNDAIRLDDSCWPVVIVEPIRRPSSAEVDLFVSQLEQLAASKQAPFAVLLDARGSVRLTGKQRKIVAQGFKRGAIKEHVRAEAVLLHSPLLAFLGRLLLALIRPKFRMGAFGDYERAFAWAKARAEE